MPDKPAYKKTKASAIALAEHWAIIAEEGYDRLIPLSQAHAQTVFSAAQIATAWATLASVL